MEIAQVATLSPNQITATALVFGATATAAAAQGTILPPLGQPTLDPGQAPAAQPTTDPFQQPAPIATAQPTVGAAGQVCGEHLISPGENLFRIAQRYNVTVQQMAQANNIVNPDLILAGDTLTVQNVVSTLMACADAEVNRQEQVYFEALQSAQRFELVGDQLTIWYDDGQRLNFVRTDAPGGGQVGQPVEPFEDVDSPVGLLASYYNAINRQDYQRAYGYWETPAEPFDQFASGFADTVSARVIIERESYSDLISKHHLLREQGEA